MLITTDQQRYDTLGCNGADWMPTPALDALTAAGYRTHHIGKAHFYPWDCPSEENLPQFPGESLRNFAGFETAELTVGHSDWGVTGH